MKFRTIAFFLLTLVACSQQDFNTQSGKISKLNPGKNKVISFDVPPPKSSYLYVGNFDGKLYALDPATGAQLWAAQTDGPIFSSPTAAYGQVYIASNGSFYSFDAATGSLIWKNAKTPIHTYDTISSPMVYNNTVLAGGNATYFGAPPAAAGLLALEAGTGNVIWTSLNGMTIDASPTVADVGNNTTLVFVGASNINGNNAKAPDFFALDFSTGQVVWQVFLGAGSYSSPAVVNGIVYAVSINNQIYALDAATGTIIWKKHMGAASFSSPTVDQGIVYVGCGNGILYAFDAKTGNLNWSAATTGAMGYSSPIVYKGNVYIGDCFLKLYSFNALTGVQQWAVTTNGTCNSSPTVADGVIYIGNGNIGTNFYAFDYATGSLIWSTLVGNSAIGSSACVITPSLVEFHPGISGEQQ